VESEHGKYDFSPDIPPYIREEKWFWEKIKCIDLGAAMRHFPGDLTKFTNLESLSFNISHGSNMPPSWGKFPKPLVPPTVAPKFQLKKLLNVSALLGGSPKSVGALLKYVPNLSPNVATARLTVTVDPKFDFTTLFDAWHHLKEFSFDVWNRDVAKDFLHTFFFNHKKQFKHLKIFKLERSDMNRYYSFYPEKSYNYHPPLCGFLEKLPRHMPHLTTLTIPKSSKFMDGTMLVDLLNAIEQCTTLRSVEIGPGYYGNGESKAKQVVHSQKESQKNACLVLRKICELFTKMRYLQNVLLNEVLAHNDVLKAFPSAFHAVDVVVASDWEEQVVSFKKTT